MLTTAPRQTGTDVAIVARGLVKRYGELVAVDGIDLEVARGSCVGVLGPNGAGKTTTIEMLEGLKKPDEGAIEVLGRTWNDNPRWIQERIGVQLQETEFQDKLTPYEILRLFRSFYVSGDDPEHTLEVVGLTDKRDARFTTLSGGQKQRLSIGCALLSRPEVLFLDEPTTGLDPQARRRLWEIIEAFKADGGTVLLTTHYMEEAERLADDLMIFDRGRVIARGTPPSLVAGLEVESVVRFSLIEGTGTIDEPAIRALNGVRAVRREGADTVLSVTRTHEVIAGLFTLVEDRGAGIDDLRTHRPTLEDVFVALTGKQLRDE